jgi:hypothetical protein
MAFIDNDTQPVHFRRLAFAAANFIFFITSESASLASVNVR